MYVCITYLPTPLTMDRVRTEQVFTSGIFRPLPKHLIAEETLSIFVPLVEPLPQNRLFSQDFS